MVAKKVAEEEIPSTIPGEDKLALYGLYKQALEGDNTSSEWLHNSPDLRLSCYVF